MEQIKGLLLEPVGCLAEFPSGPFHEIATRFFGRKGKASPSASRSYWHLLNLMEASEAPLDETQLSQMEALEAEAVAGATIYEDVAPALAELKGMNVQLVLATSLSRSAALAFVERSGFGQFLTGACSRDDADGIKAAPLVAALDSALLPPGQTIFLTDTVEGIQVARMAGVHPILMMNDPDEAQRLSTHNPTGGVVSFHEIPDFVRLIAAQRAAFGASQKAR